MSTDTITYTPASGSIAAKVIDYFRVNPEEELTRRDIADKFEVAAASVDNCLKKAQDAGLLATRNNDEMVRCWVAGPSISKATQAKSARRPRTGIAPLDLAAIKVESGIEKPKPKNVNSPAYTAVINQLQPGSSVLLPSVHAKRLIDLAKKLAKEAGSSAKYSIG